MDSYYSTPLCRNEFCMVATALTSSLIFSFAFSKKELKTNFENTLDENQLEIYKKLKRERLYIFIIALILAVVLSYFTYRMQRNYCFTISTAIIALTMIYKMWPKSDYILNHIYSSDQGATWMKLNKNMSILGNIGLLFGGFVYIIIMSM